MTKNDPQKQPVAPPSAARPAGFTAHRPSSAEASAATKSAENAANPKSPSAPVARDPTAPKEIGGPKGPEPTRYGDWERDGRCVDF